FIHRAAGAAASAGVLRLLSACAPKGDATSPADRSLADLRDRYFLRTLEFYPVTSTYLGGDGYAGALAPVNGRLRDVSPEGIAAQVAFYKGVREELAAVDREALSPARRIDHDVLGAQLAFMLHQLDEKRYHERAVDTYVAEPFRGVDWQIQQMKDVGGGLLGDEAEWDLVLHRVEWVPGFLEAARGQLEAGLKAGNLPDWRMVERDGIAGRTANAEYFRVTLPETAKRFVGDRPFATQFLSRLAQAGDHAARAYEEFAAFLRAKYDLAARVDRYAAGEEEYGWRVKNNLRVRRTVAELWEYGATQVELYEGKIFAVAERVAREANLGLPFDTPEAKRASVRKVVEHLGQDAPKDDDELLRWYVEAGERAVTYGRERGLFDIPRDYRLDVVATPPVLRSTIDAAYYPAPPFKTSGVGRFYLTPTGNDPAALRLNNRASVATTAIHEGFPGHDWHYKYMTQFAQEIPNLRWLTPGAVEDSSSMWADSMAAEGWALYSEELMAEPAEGRPDGFYSAGELLYMLQAQLMRAVRVRVDTGIHTGRMTFDEAVDYFAEHVEFYPRARAAQAADPAAKAIMAGAERAIYRYSKWPTQAITYNLGKNEILALREEVRTARGDRFDAKRFHEEFMRMGTVPAAFVREALLGAPA
ncbi:MAG TPA: DUF885 domain-containing protein, partial [Gemmatimonadales bacterium]|nr:DUF885 domain-containing protein [Gemmatimonadales bacterium]